MAVRYPFFCGFPEAARADSPAAVMKRFPPRESLYDLAISTATSRSVETGDLISMTNHMRFIEKTVLTAAVGLSLVAGSAFAGALRDWHDLDEVHKHIVESIHEMERARSANHYDMDGHGAKAEALLREAESEVRLAVESARKQ